MPLRTEKMYLYRRYISYNLKKNDYGIPDCFFRHKAL